MHISILFKLNERWASLFSRLIYKMSVLVTKYVYKQLLPLWRTRSTAHRDREIDRGKAGKKKEGQMKEYKPLPASSFWEVCA